MTDHPDISRASQLTASARLLDLNSADDPRSDREIFDQWIAYIDTLDDGAVPVLTNMGTLRVIQRVVARAAEANARAPR